MIIHLYKLVTGEVVIAQFIDVEMVNDKTGAKSHVLANPMIINKYGELSPWVYGLIGTTKYYIRERDIIMGGEQDSISHELLEHYLSCFAQ